MRHLSAIALALTCAAFASCDKAGPEPAAVPGPVSFYREYVVVEPSAGRTRVVGDYYFRNVTEDSVTVEMSYPFPVDAHHAEPLRIRAWLVEDDEERPIGFINDGDAIRWRMSFEPRSERRVRVEYVQTISRNHAKYIVTTTKLWGQPIELAEFEFRVQRSLGELEFSFEPDRSEARGDTVIYFAKRVGFLPDRDLEVCW